MAVCPVGVLVVAAGHSLTRVHVRPEVGTFRGSLSSASVDVVPDTSLDALGPGLRCRPCQFGKAGLSQVKSVYRAGCALCCLLGPVIGHLIAVQPPVRGGPTYGDHVTAVPQVLANLDDSHRKQLPGPWPSRRILIYQGSCH